MKKYIGIDIGGMSIKGIVIDDSGKAYAEDSIKTGVEFGEDAICRNICALIKSLTERSGGSADIQGVGIGCPGMIDAAKGVVKFAGNLKLKEFPLAERITKALGVKVRITNDANAAALGEAKYGAGRDYNNSILLTLGTGVGGGIIIDDKLFEGTNSAGAELGHTVIVRGGFPCTCGRQGCLEAYASAAALVKMTRKAMSEHPESQMWQGYKLETVNGKTAFAYPDDPTAKLVVDAYITFLACGIVNFANIFRPQVIMLGGGISGEGERLTVPLQKLLDKELFGGQNFAPVKVVCASLGSKAGVYGAANLIM